MEKELQFRYTADGLNQLIKDLILSREIQKVYEIVVDGISDSYELTDERFKGVLDGEMGFYADDDAIVFGSIEQDEKWLKQRDEAWIPFVEKAPSDKVYYRENGFPAWLYRLYGTPFQAVKKTVLEQLKARPKTFHGTFLRDGSVIYCGSMGHDLLYRTLCEIGETETSDWCNCETTIKFSSEMLSGKIAMDFKFQEYDGVRYPPSDAQIHAILRSNITEIYGGESFFKGAADYITKITDGGRKYGNLVFLRDYCGFLLEEHGIQLPFFEKLDRDKEYPAGFIRTSPEKSLPSLLNSRNYGGGKVDAPLFDLFQCEFGEKNFIEDNKLHLFYQDFVPGSNGVCQVLDGEFEYALAEQGVIVGGGKGIYTLPSHLEINLKNFALEVYRRAMQPVQFEFVSDGQQLYIVQMRFLELGEKYYRSCADPEICSGDSFYRGFAHRVSLSDVLIIDSEMNDATQLIGKKALIVRQKPQFSHALALSAALKIPSITGVGDFDFSKHQTITVNTTGQLGTIHSHERTIKIHSHE